MEDRGDILPQVERSNVNFTDDDKFSRKRSNVNETDDIERKRLKKSEKVVSETIRVSNDAIKCSELRSYWIDKKTILLLDVRSAEMFQKKKINLEGVKSINVGPPRAIIYTPSNISHSFDDQSDVMELWTKRKTFDLVVIVDETIDGSARALTSNNGRKLFKVLNENEFPRKYKCLKYLDGGFKEWKHKYPLLCTIQEKKDKWAFTTECDPFFGIPYTNASDQIKLPTLDEPASVRKTIKPPSASASAIAHSPVIINNIPTQRPSFVTNTAKQVPAINRQTKGHQDQVMNLKKQLADKERNLTAEREKTLGLHNQLKGLHTELNSKKHNVRSLEVLLQTRQAEISSIAEKLQHANKEKGQAQQIQQGHQDQVMNLKKQLADKEHDLTAEREKTLGLHNQLKGLHTELNSKKHNVRSLEVLLQTRQAEISSIAEKLQHANKEKGQAQQIQQGHQDQVMNLKKQLADKERDLTAEREKTLGLHNQLKGLHTELNSKKHNVRSLEVLLQTRQAEISSIAEKLQHANKEKGQAQQIQQGHQDQVMNLKKQLADKERDLTAEQEKTLGLHNQLKELRTELNSEKHNVRSLEVLLQTRQAEISSIAVKLQHANEEKQGQAQQIQQLQSKLGDERRVALKLQEESGQAQGAFQQELLAERQQTEMLIATLNEQIRQQQEGHQDQVMNLKKQLADKERDLTAEQEKTLGLHNQLKELRTELNSEKHNVRSLEVLLQTRQAEISSIAVKLQHANEEKQGQAQQIQQLQSKLGDERRVALKLQEESGQAQGAFQQELLAERQQTEMLIATLNEQIRQQQEGHQDQVMNLKKQLADKEHDLTAEQEKTLGLHNQLKELRTELNSEKHNVRSLEVLLQTSQAEISSIAVKPQHANEEKQGQAQQIQQDIINILSDEDDTADVSNNGATLNASPTRKQAIERGLSNTSNVKENHQTEIRKKQPVNVGADRSLTKTAAVVPTDVLVAVGKSEFRVGKKPEEKKIFTKSDALAPPEGQSSIRRRKRRRGGRRKVLRVMGPDGVLVRKRFKFNKT